MKTSRIVALVLFIVLMVFAAQPHSALAGVTGSLHKHGFPTATATDCRVFGGHGGIIVRPRECCHIL